MTDHAFWTAFWTAFGAVVGIAAGLLVVVGMLTVGRVLPEMIRWLSAWMMAIVVTVWKRMR